MLNSWSSQRLGSSSGRLFFTQWVCSHYATRSHLLLHSQTYFRCSPIAHLASRGNRELWLLGKFRLIAQIHSATVRIVVAILISQASIFFKQLFSGTFWSICYVLAMMGFTGLFLYILDRRPLITPDKFPEDEQRLDTANLQRWWNVFSYPLAPKTNAHLSKTASILCRPLSPSLRRLEQNTARRLEGMVATHHSRKEQYSKTTRRF
jgi:hypothetical protein